MVVQCCVCKKIRENGVWVHPERELDSMTVSHGYCPECAAEAFAEIREWAERNCRQQNRRESVA